MKKLFRISIVMIILMAGLLSGCKKTSEPTDTKPNLVEETTKPEVETPVEKDGEEVVETGVIPSHVDLNLALEAEGATMDPYNTGLTVDLRVQEQFLEGLVFANENTSEISPRLAESYNISEDGLVYTFKLREDVIFHNGDQLRASDVIFSYLRAKESAQMAKFTSEIVDVKAVDDLTVEISLKNPYFPFIYYLDKVKIVSERAVTEAGDLFGAIPSDCGTGPYRLVEYNPSTMIILEAFPQYYRGEPAIKTIKFYVIVDQSTSLIAFQNGEIDYLEVPVANWPEIKDSGLYTTETAETGHITYLALNVGQDGPLGNKLVRQAIQYAIDKQAAIDIVFNGMASIADHEIRPGLYAGAQETEFVYNYDPAKAKELLAEAGYPDGVDIGQIQAAPAIYQMVAEVLQAQLAEVGITAQVLKGDLSAMVVDWRAGNYDAICCAYTPAFTYDYARSRIDSRNDTVMFKYDRCEECDHEYINNMLDKASIELDEAKRNATYLELEEYLLDVAASVPIKYSVRSFAWDKNLSAKPYLNLFQVFDWSWN